MGMRPGSDIKSPYRLFLPDKFYSQFSIAFTLKLVDPTGGFLFAVVNPLETSKYYFQVVELGVSVTGLGPGQSNVSLLYTDLSTGLYTSQTLASFRVPTSFTSWSSVGLTVRDDRVDISFNCQPLDSIIVNREPKELIFDSASTLYIGQAGPIVKGALHVSTMFLFLTLFSYKNGQWIHVVTCNIFFFHIKL
ncbi:hypothetical protein O3M35_011284 [Rhynocoris fuscipes]|uniref:Laminin G domain-containing protein n=1 Tax=Rhynocoris fuscipes TaxID=488301 RepID=A0AAW1D2E0_9HEMI